MEYLLSEFPLECFLRKMQSTVRHSPGGVIRLYLQLLGLRMRSP